MDRRITKIDTRSQASAYRGSAIFMGIPFVAVGAYFALAGFGALPLAGKANAPLWVIGAIGLAFFGAGLLVFVNGVRGVRRQRRARRLSALGVDEPWLLDHDWDPAGVDDPAAWRPLRAWSGMALMVAFLAPFHWWAFFSQQGPFLVQAIVVVFDLVLLYGTWETARQTIALFQHGKSRLTFGRFPFFVGERVDVVFSPNRFDALEITLRFVQERFETAGSGRHRSSHHVTEALFTETRTVRSSSAMAEAPLRFDLPARPELVTELSGQPVRYWELVVAADTPGIDFRTTFPLPVYARPGAEDRGPGADAEPHDPAAAVSAPGRRGLRGLAPSRIRV